MMVSLGTAEAQDIAAGAWLRILIAVVVAQIVLFVAGVVSVLWSPLPTRPSRTRSTRSTGRAR
jgi:hypothetical protein